MRALFKWALSPIFLVCFVVMFFGFILYVLVDEGPRAAWREMQIFGAAVFDDCKSFFGKY